MICAISGHFRDGISASEITLALGELHEYDRLAAVRCIEKNEELRQRKMSITFWGTCGSQGTVNFVLCDYAYFSQDGTTKWFVPFVCPPQGSRWAEPVYFGAACRAHDACYSRPGTRKSQCDAELRTFIEETCDQTLAGDSWLKGRQACRRNARTAQSLVSGRLGCFSYRRAQRRSGIDDAVCD
jgi:hypothetical protein